MNSIDLEAFSDVYRDLWGKSLTVEQQHVFMMASEGCDAHRCTEAAREHALRSKYPLRPFDLKKALQGALDAIAETYGKAADDESWQNHIAQCQRDRDQRDLVWGELTNSERLKHKEAALIDSRLTWMSKTAIDSPGWRWIIYQRVSANMEPDDPGIPPV